MRITHHNLIVELDDSWWAEAGMQNFVPSASTYRVDATAARKGSVFEVSFDEVRPGQRNPGVGIFNSNAQASAKDRVVSLLRGFRENSAIPPVELLPDETGSNFGYKLAAGYHRFYCSLAAGYSRVPAVIGFDANA